MKLLPAGIGLSEHGMLLASWRIKAGGAVVLAILALGAEDATSTKYGSITGQFVFEGDIPPREVLVMKGNTKVNDPAICAAEDNLSDALLVDESTRGIAGVFFYLPKAKGVHPRLKTSEVKEVVFDQEKCRFIPHSLVVRTDQAVLVKSKDKCAHNTRGTPLKNTPFNFSLAPEDRAGSAVRLKVAERFPIPIECNIHPWMRANWLVIDHPYGAVSDTQGKFEIADLPEGNYEFAVWHELPGYVERKYSVTVKAGQTVDLGEIKLSAKVFTEKKK